MLGKYSITELHPQPSHINPVLLGQRMGDQVEHYKWASFKDK
jgi:hypothetical protein